MRAVSRRAVSAEKTVHFPTREGIYDDFKFVVEGKEVKEIRPADGKITEKMSMGPNQKKRIRISYRSQGKDEWSCQYSL